MHLILGAANEGVDLNLAQNIGFAIIAIFMVYGAFRVVTTTNVVHAALFLVMVLAGAAAQFILLGAEFVALTQVLVYIGAVVVLFLFGIMLTKAPIAGDADLSRKNWFGAAIVGALMFGLLSFTLLDTFGGDRLPADTRLTLRPAAISQFEAETGIATAGLSQAELVEQVNSLEVTEEEQDQYLKVADAIGMSDGPLDSNTGAVSDSIFGEYLLAFEVVSILLTAALIGAIVLARKE